MKKVWGFFSDPANLSRITPPAMKFKILTSLPYDEVYPGAVIEYMVKPLPLFRTRWVTEITALEKEKYFIDEQRFGPYRFWHHQHLFRSIKGGVQMTDIVHYRLPFEPFSSPLHPLLVKPKLNEIFSFREKAVKDIFG